MVLKKIIFRADGNSNIGLGHLYRILALVEMYNEQYECVFITRSDSELSVFSKKYELILIPDNISVNDEPKWLSNFFQPSNFLIILDGYHFNFNYQLNIKKSGFNLMFIDDYTKKMTATDIIVNHSLSVTEDDFGLSNKTKFGLGTKYAILRPAFLKEAQKYKLAKPIKKAFICFGGADFNNLTFRYLKVIIKIINFKEIHVVVGSAYKQKEIFKIIEKNKEKVFLHNSLDEKQMLDLMKKCHLAILPASTISYEACAVKMIILGGYYIENQINIYNGLNKADLIYAAGDFNLMKEEDFKNKINSILYDTHENHQKKLDNQKLYFDGKQKERFLKLTKNILC